VDLSVFLGVLLIWLHPVGHGRRESIKVGSVAPCPSSSPCLDEVLTCKKNNTR